MMGINKEALKKRLRKNLANHYQYRDNSRNHSRNFSVNSQMNEKKNVRRGSTISNAKKFRNNRLILDASSYGPGSKRNVNRVVYNLNVTNNIQNPIIMGVRAIFNFRRILTSLL